MPHQITQLKPPAETRHPWPLILWHLLKVSATFRLHHFSGQYSLWVCHGLSAEGIPPLVQHSPCSSYKGDLSLGMSALGEVLCPWLLCSQFYKTLVCLCSFQTEQGCRQALSYLWKGELSKWALASWPRRDKNRLVWASSSSVCAPGMSQTQTASVSHQGRGALGWPYMCS